jgi:coproporphyrinogen III oxidase-like Fe-S oxidoreductase
LGELSVRFGRQSVDSFRYIIAELERDGLLQRDGDIIRLTSQGRLISNEAFEKFLSPEEAPTAEPHSIVE